MQPLATVIARRRRNAHTTILAQRRGPPPIVLVPLAAGFCLAVVVDRALGEPPAPLDPADAAAVTPAPSSEPPPPPAPKVEIGEAVLRPHAASTPPAPVAVDQRAGERVLARALTKVLVDGKTPYGATVLLEVGSGRVLAIAEHSTRGDAEGLALRPMAPAASVFKIVTSSALLRAGVPASERVCARGGMRRLQERLLVDDARKDRDCTTLFDALPRSQNTAIAKLALKHLDPEALREEARRFGFDAPLAISTLPDAPLDERHQASPSMALIPDDPFGFAESASGFGDVKLSALHGAVLASVVATGGVLVPPRLTDHDGAADARRVLDQRHAETLRRMMAETVTSGTARRAFASGPRLKHGAAGKTGSLTDYTTGLDTSWFVGFAPADRPQVAVATVVVNQGKWHVKAPWVAKEALRSYFAAKEREQKAVVARR